MVRRWMDAAAAQLRNFGTVPVAAVAQDGGLALEDMVSHLDTEEFDRLNRELFLTQ